MKNQMKGVLYYSVHSIQCILWGIFFSSLACEPRPYVQCIHAMNERPWNNKQSNSKFNSNVNKQFLRIMCACTMTMEDGNVYACKA